jgi:hypothetical protein
MILDPGCAWPWVRLQRLHMRPPGQHRLIGPRSRGAVLRDRSIGC